MAVTSARSAAGFTPADVVGSPAWVANNNAAAFNNALDSIAGVARDNNAYSASQAEELRKWQEEQNRKAMEFNAAEAAKNRDWQEYMSNTAHQREIADLKAAGLNPVLSATGGNGAAVTSGATASGVTSSGAKGDVDTSVNAALASILGTLWDNENKLKIADINAKNNLAVAEKYTAMNELVAQIGAVTSRYVSDNSLTASRVMAGATQYAADRNYASTKLSTESAQKIAQWANANSVNLKNLERYNEEYIKKNYPQNEIGAIAAIISQLIGSDTSVMDIFNGSSYKNNVLNNTQKGSGRK